MKKEKIFLIKIDENYHLSTNKQTKKGFHSSSASPTLLKLTSLGLIIRNNKGHYKFKK